MKAELRAFLIALWIAYRVRVSGPKMTQRYVAGSAFCHHYGIEHSEARRYLVASTIGDMVVVNLSEPGEVVTSNRKRPVVVF